ncbi:DUF4870 domain-containing protein [Paenibacillus sp. YPG26]|uniref:DUF4870 domain-containing protein n=1 Tax=Paenibacillus sp. YPG26 TaxID=2878915 RepID=UPI00203C29EC|nr:DUF4870 domain-containing protein [Paenibacillus sp. YPG26]USB34215.1 hypothetical protein LDO05_05295 [Paenibacillus sp. YPG26]
MRTILSSLCYFSIFFAPFLLPVIVWFISNDAVVRKHAGRALLSHIFPVLAALPLLYFMFSAQYLASIFMYVAVFALIYFCAFLYNVIQGIRILSNAKWPQQY